MKVIFKTTILLAAISISAFVACEVIGSGELRGSKEVRDHKAEFVIDSGTRWNSEPTYSSGALGLKSHCFIGQTVGFASTNDGWKNSIFKTSDGGKSWNVIGRIENAVIDKFNFVSEDEGFAISTRLKPSSYPIENGSDILRTVDGGIRWESVFFSSSTVFHSLKFNSSGIGIAVGEKGLQSAQTTFALVLSTDNGKTWRDFSDRINSAFYYNKPSSSVYLKDVEIINEATILALSNRGDLFTSHDTGNTWKHSSVLTITDQKFHYTKIGQSNGRNWIFGVSSSAEWKFGIVSIESDSGWDRYRLENFTFSDFLLGSNGEVIACGSQAVTGAANQSVRTGIVVRSLDNGLHWEVVYKSENIQNFVSFFKMPNEKYRLVGDNGAIVELSKSKQ